MTIHAGLLVALLITTTMAAWFGTFVIVPSVMVSRYRYALWKMRDDIVLDLARGKLEPSPCLFQLLDDIEVRIAHAHEMRMLHVLGAVRFAVRHEERLARVELDVPPADAERISGWRNSMRRADVIAVFTTSVTGVAVAFCIGLVAAASRLLLRRPAGLRARVADEYQEAADEISWPHRDRDLAAFV